MTGPRSLLILSLSPLRSDPRVLKQISLFRDKYRVFTCGFGPAPDGVAGHFELDTALASWPRDPQRLALRRYVDVYWNIAAVAQARKLLRGQQFDAVLANDTNTVPLALGLEPRHGVHADLHEFAPKEHFNKPAWRVLVAPYVRWLCRTYLPAARSVTTVAEGIAEQYTKDFGVAASVVTNAAPYADKQPRPTGDKIRMIYSSAGTAVPQDRRHHGSHARCAGASGTGPDCDAERAGLRRRAQGTRRGAAAGAVPRACPV